MDPRMDSGVANQDKDDQGFDPLRELLPEEVCWLLDMAISCEV
jgi:hypothetical protein